MKENLTNKICLGAGLVIGVFLCLSPIWTAFIRLESLEAITTSTIAIGILIAASSKGRDEYRELKFVVGIGIGFVLTVNSENGNLLGWTIQWFLVAVAAIMTRICSINLRFLSR